MQLKNSKQIVLEIESFMISSGLTQLQLSYCSKINQSTLSKYLKEPPKKITPALKKICNYAEISLFSDELSSPEKNMILMQALRENWDGTDEHARKISKIISAIGS